MRLFPKTTIGLVPCTLSPNINGGCTDMRRLGRYVLLGVSLVVLLLMEQSMKASSDSFAAGDIFVSLSNGDVQWRHADGSLKQILKSGVGPAKSLAFDASGNLYVPHWFTNLIAKFDSEGQLMGTF